jgi:hypothetical protein
MHVQNVLHADDASTGAASEISWVVPPEAETPPVSVPPLALDAPPAFGAPPVVGEASGAPLLFVLDEQPTTSRNVSDEKRSAALGMTECTSCRSASTMATAGYGRQGTNQSRRFAVAWLIVNSPQTGTK